MPITSILTNFTLGSWKDFDVELSLIGSTEMKWELFSRVSHFLHNSWTNRRCECKCELTLTEHFKVLVTFGTSFFTKRLKDFNVQNPRNLAWCSLNVDAILMNITFDTILFLFLIWIFKVCLALSRIVQFVILKDLGLSLPWKYPRSTVHKYYLSIKYLFQYQYLHWWPHQCKRSLCLIYNVNFALQC